MDDLISRQAAIDAAALSAAEWDGMYVQDINGRIREALEKLPPAQPEYLESEDVTFWKKRAKEYEKMAEELTDEMARGVKIDSVLLTEEGIVFKKKKPEQQWIPCSERLPAEGVKVLACLNDWKTGEIKTVVSYRIDYTYWHGYGRYNEKCVAWMPLPEPWEGGEADD